MSKPLVSYNFEELQDKWAKLWLAEDIYAAEDFSKKPKKYVLVEFPYPSGAGLHMGHCRNYTMMDAYVRFHRMNGFNVLYPMGWDAFGLPTYNYAIKVGKDPHEVTKENVATFKRQLNALGLSFDWNREVNSTDPSYYKWTQWIFIQLFEHYYDKNFKRVDGGVGQARPIADLAIPEDVKQKGDIAIREYKDAHRLAFKANIPVYWCPSCKTAVANEEVTPQMTHERCDTPVEKRDKNQWMFRITEYADRLIEDLATVDYPMSVSSSQINWIGKSHGIEITYKIKETENSVTVYTTKPETNFGATFIVVAPDSKFVEQNRNVFQNKEEVDRYIAESLAKSDMDRVAEGKKKTGVFTGLYAINQLTNREMPIYISDFVLATVGTGCVVGVPGHDIRDFEFAQAMNIPILRVIKGSDNDESEITTREQVQEEEGHIVNSDFLNGLELKEAREKVMDYIESKGYGTRVTNYKLRDWVFSRQHYWGEPTPMVYCEQCGWQALSVFDLPLELPVLEDYKMGEDGSSPLERDTAWIKTTCPNCKGEAKRETDVMPNWAGSNWYFLRYIDPNNKEKLADANKLKYWMQVDIYDGGAEHNNMHLLYSRFINKFLFDVGASTVSEPYKARRTHGIVLGTDGKKMSKSKGNVINPDDYVTQYGADIVRMYVMFMGPYEGNLVWSIETLNGVRRFMNRVYEVMLEKIASAKDKSYVDHEEVTQALAVVGKKVAEDIAALKFNTAVASLMEFMNIAEKKDISIAQIEAFLKILAPFAPFVSEELWKTIGHTDFVHAQEWPKFENIAESDTVEIPIQVNGKLRGVITISKTADQSTVAELASKVETVAQYLQSGIKKTIYIPGKMISFVV